MPTKKRGQKGSPNWVTYIHLTHRAQLPALCAAGFFLGVSQLCFLTAAVPPTQLPKKIQPAAAARPLEVLAVYLIKMPFASENEMYV